MLHRDLLRRKTEKDYKQRQMQLPKRKQTEWLRPQPMLPRHLPQKTLKRNDKQLSKPKRKKKLDRLKQKELRTQGLLLNNWKLKD